MCVHVNVDAPPPRKKKVWHPGINHLGGPDRVWGVSIISVEALLCCFVCYHEQGIEKDTRACGAYVFDVCGRLGFIAPFPKPKKHEMFARKRAHSHAAAVLYHFLFRCSQHQLRSSSSSTDASNEPEES